jgi:hypothetical protein
MQKETSQSQRAPQGLACQLPPAPWLTSADSFRHFHPHFVLTSINRNRKCHTSFRQPSSIPGERLTKKKKGISGMQKKSTIQGSKKKKGTNRKRVWEARKFLCFSL